MENISEKKTIICNVVMVIDMAVIVVFCGFGCYGCVCINSILNISMYIQYL
jgi:hypothetical protein